MEDAGAEVKQQWSLWLRSVRVMGRWLVFGAGLYFLPLVLIWLAVWLVPEPLRDHVTDAGALVGVMVVVGAFFLSLFLSARAAVLGGDSAEAIHRSIREQLRFELRAADLTSRLTVASLALGLLYWGGRQIGAGVTSIVDPVDLATFKSSYIDVALLAGPLVGMLWWSGEQFARAGREAAEDIAHASARAKAGEPPPRVHSAGFALVALPAICWAAWALTG